MGKMKVAVIGCGAITREKHLPAFGRLGKTIEISAVCDKNERLAADMASEWKIPRHYTNISELLAENRIDIVDICTPPRSHASIAVEALGNGCHVIMEKPMALTSKECDEILIASSSNKSKVCVIHNDLFHSPFIRAKRLIEAGRIGRFLGMRIFLSTPRWDMIDLSDHWYHSLPGGVIGETGPHIAYMSLAFIGKPKSVSMSLGNTLNLDWAPYDEFMMDITGEKGFCQTLLTYNRNCWTALVDIVGSEAMLTLDLERMLVIEHRIERLELSRLAKSTVQSAASTLSDLCRNAGLTILGRQVIGTELIIQEFVKSIIDDKNPPVTGEDGKATVELMEMIVGAYNRASNASHNDIKSLSSSSMNCCDSRHIS